MSIVKSVVDGNVAMIQMAPTMFEKFRNHWENGCHVQAEMMGNGNFKYVLVTASEHNIKIAEENGILSKDEAASARAQLPAI